MHVRAVAWGVPAGTPLTVPAPIFAQRMIRDMTGNKEYEFGDGSKALAEGSKEAAEKARAAPSLLGTVARGHAGRHEARHEANGRTREPEQSMLAHSSCFFLPTQAHQLAHARTTRVRLR